MTKALEKFLGVARWKALWRAWLDAGVGSNLSQVPPFLLLVSIFLAIVPVLSIVLVAQSDFLPGYIPTVIFGIATILALYIRKTIGIGNLCLKLGWNDFSLTHTAFALGCVPVVLLLLYDPATFADRHEVISNVVSPAPKAGMQKWAYLQVLGSLVFISAWVAFTEEILFRGVLLSALRRVRFSSNQKLVDVVAIILSALVFGLAHLSSWGLLPSIALMGLGCGFGLAYVVTKERVFPTICYHFLFDLLSLSFSVFI